MGCTFSCRRNKSIDQNVNQIDALRQANAQDISYFNLKNYQTMAKVASCYDGDTCSLIFYYNGQLVKFRCRLAGIDCAEIKSVDLEEVKHAIKALNRLYQLIGPEKMVNVKFGDFDKYGRLLVELKTMDDDTNINQILLDEHLAYKYSGGARVPFSIWKN